MEKKILLLIFVLALTIRLAPLSIDSFMGPDPNFHARMSEQIIEEQKLVEYDELSLQGRPYSYAPLYHTSFATISIASSVSPYYLVRIFPAIYGALAVLLAFVFSRKLFPKENYVWLFAALAVAVMPMHIIRTASYARPDGLALVIIPFVLYFLYTQRYKISVLLSVGLVLLHPFSTLYLLLLILALIIVLKFKRQELQWQKLFAVVVLTFVVYIIWLSTQQQPLVQYISNISFESAELSKLTLTGILTFFTFSWIFVLVALAKMKENYFLKIWLGFSVAFALIGLRAAIFMAMPMALFAGFGLNVAFENLKKYKKAFFVLIFILLLATILPRVYTFDKYTTEQDRAGISWLAEYTPEESVIASQWDFGHPITYRAKRAVVIDGYFEYAPGLDERKEATEILRQSSNCETIAEQIEKFDIGYFYIPKKSEGGDSYKYGALEADCSEISKPYSNDSVMIFAYD